MSALVRDLRHALRSLSRSPGFAGVAVVTLALGIGAATALFSVVDGVLVRSLPYEEPDRVVRILGYNTEEGLGHGTISYPNFLDWRRDLRSFEAMAAYDEWDPALRVEDQPQRIHGASVSAAFFRVLGVESALGRTFHPAEEEPGAHAAVVLRHDFWRTHLGGEPEAVGGTLELSGTPYTVVGVLSPGFEDPGLHGGPPEVNPVVWRVTPSYFQASRTSRSGRSFTAVGRLRPGVDPDEATREIDAWLRASAELHPSANGNRAVRVVTVKEQLVGGVRTPLLILLGAAGLVLLIACANVANLLLARGTHRRREVAVRRALGASVARVLGLVLTEGVLLAAGGGALGVLLAYVGTDALLAVGGAQLPRPGRIGVDPRVVGFAVATSVLTVALFGLLPAMGLARRSLAGALGEGARGGSQGRGQRRVQRLLVGGEVALSVMLLVGATLLARSLWTLQSVDPGLEPEGLLAVELQPSSRAYPGHAEVDRLYDALLDEVRAVPGVERAATVDLLPMGGSFNGLGFRLVGRPEPEPGTGPSAQGRSVTPGYFRTAEIPVRRGRAVTSTDRHPDPPVVVINQAMARRFWPGTDPLGERVALLDTVFSVVGVVGDVHLFGPDLPAEPTMYFAHRQMPQLWMKRPGWLVIRTAGEPASLAPAVRAAVRSVDPGLVIGRVRPMEAIVARTLLQPRFRTFVLGVFAAIAFLLGALGIYGVTAYSVARRRREVGIRMALGARAGRVVGMVMRQGLAPVAAGAAAGLAGAWLGGRLLASVLYGVSPADPVTFVGVPLALIVVAAVACWLPARRAARVDPVTSLRDE